MDFKQTYKIILWKIILKKLVQKGEYILVQMLLKKLLKNSEFLLQFHYSFASYFPQYFLFSILSKIFVKEYLIFVWR